MKVPVLEGGVLKLRKVKELVQRLTSRSDKTRVELGLTLHRLCSFYYMTIFPFKGKFRNPISYREV